jgi:hypothetical protein
MCASFGAKVGATLPILNKMVIVVGNEMHQKIVPDRMANHQLYELINKPH